MANKVLLTPPDTAEQQICVCENGGGGFSPTAANDLRDATSGNIQEVLITLAGVLDGEARQSALFDLGPKWADGFSVLAAIEAASGVAEDEKTMLYWAPSATSGGNGNLAGIGASDADYDGYGSNLDASLKQIQTIGPLIMTANATPTVQTGFVADFYPRFRYGALVVKPVGFDLHSDDDEMHVILQPIVPEQQD